DLDLQEIAAEALEQQRERVPLPARRGAVYDRDGVPLALSHETYRVSVAPRELRDRGATRTLLVEALGVPRTVARKATDPGRRWVVLPGRFSTEQRERVGRVAGVYFERQLERFYPQGRVGRELTGVMSSDGRALGGVEQQFDDLLRGEHGYSVLRRDARGRTQAALSLPVVPPTDGADVQLTIDLDLQEIADEALRSAVASANASGGDLLLLDVRTGEILAAASRRRGRTGGLTAITEPYEPGSTLKPLVAAALLAEGRVGPGDRVHAEEGRWETSERTITDTHALGWVSLDEVIRESSNIGIVKFASRLQPGVQYRYLRDFGFGTPTGVEYPSESSGRLRRPANWSKLSSGSLAMGYEIAVTPLQLAAAYGALANGGVLMEPHLLREIRGPDGSRLEAREARPLRRVVPEDVAAQVTEMLAAVVQDGTATRASIEKFAVAGKTGTSRRTGANGRYIAGSYTASFVGYFPADDPQIVIFVKIDEPRGDYYGGLTAAPVTRETLQGILASRSSALDVGRLISARADAGAAARTLAGTAARMDAAATDAAGRTGIHVLELDAPPPAAPANGAEMRVRVPQLAGLSLRDAAYRAHTAGLRVRLKGSGSVASTRPEAGSTLQRGDTLLLVAEAR
ncbi:MAG TPA: penicillin-binding transpeptidase domain-containing protein, partial [Longimicrobium sp.]|nr:penicillin-binding transpeptidase domain-containing protein [Longimicrobium sp.]